MYNGDYSRKKRLVDFGFRLPSALDNRPLKPDEFEKVTKQTVYVSATPAAFEIERSSIVVEQLIRPTGLLDPEMERRPIKGQVEDSIQEIKKTVAEGYRVLVTTLTKRMTEDLTDFLRDHDVRVEYLHSDIDAIERVEILRNLRAGEFDVLVGVNLLREGLDLPEVALVIVLDADKEGFLRSETSLIQTAGRAARHEKGRVIFYADVMTQSLTKAWETCQYRREKQMTYNEKHGITPRSVIRPVQESLRVKKEDEEDNLVVAEEVSSKDTKKLAKQLEKEMIEAVKKLEFEKAALFVIKSHFCGAKAEKRVFKNKRSADTKKGSMEAGKNIIKRSSLIWVSFLVFLSVSNIPAFGILTQKRQLLFYFDKIEVNGEIDVFVEPRKRNEEALIYGDSEIIDQVSLIVRDRTLFIEANNTFDISRRLPFLKIKAERTFPVEIIIGAEKLSALSLYGRANLTVNKITASKLSVSTFGRGRFHLENSFVNSLKINQSGRVLLF